MVNTFSNLNNAEIFGAEMNFTDSKAAETKQPHKPKGSETKKTEMELRTALQQARRNGDGKRGYEILEKFCISAMESQGFIEASQFLEEMEMLAYMIPSLRGRFEKLMMKFHGPDGLPSHEEAPKEADSNVSQTSSGTEKTQMELRTELKQARENGDWGRGYDLLEKLCISAMESQDLIQASQFLEEMEDIADFVPSFRGRFKELVTKFGDAVDDSSSERSPRSNGLPSREEALRTPDSNVAKNGSGTRKTEMDLWNELEEARKNCNGILDYDALEKLTISALESQHLITASHYLEEMEEIADEEPSFRGRFMELMTRFADAGDVGEMEDFMMCPADYDDSSDEEISVDLDEDDSVQMIEPRWFQVRKITPVHKNSEFVNNVPRGNEVRLTGKVKGNRVQIDEPYRGWISTANLVQKITLPETSAAGSNSGLPTLPQMEMHSSVSVSSSPEPSSPTSSTSSAALLATVVELAAPVPLSTMDSVDQIQQKIDILEAQVQELKQRIPAQGPRTDVVEPIKDLSEIFAYGNLHQ